MGGDAERVSARQVRSAGDGFGDGLEDEAGEEVVDGLDGLEDLRGEGEDVGEEGGVVRKRRRSELLPNT